MPALFAYLTALCLLVGGGYGALNWFAAPESANSAGAGSKKLSRAQRPVVVANAGLPATIETTSTTFPEVNKVGRVAGDTVVPYLAAIDVARDRDVLPDTMRTAQQSGLTFAVPSNGLNRNVEPAAQAKPAAPASTTIPADPASRPKRLNHRHSRSPEKRKLALMTLRTIQFTDGRRVTQLIPYQGRVRALAWAAD